MVPMVEGAGVQLGLASELYHSIQCIERLAELIRYQYSVVLERHIR